MKLEDVKDRIDNYFDNISAEELYELSVKKYGFRDATNDVENETFETLGVINYEASNSNIPKAAETCKENSLALAA